MIGCSDSDDAGSGSFDSCSTTGSSRINNGGELQSHEKSLARFLRWLLHNILQKGPASEDDEDARAAKGLLLRALTGDDSQDVHACKVALTHYIGCQDTHCQDCALCRSHFRAQDRELPGCSMNVKAPDCYKLNEALADLTISDLNGRKGRCVT
eukprot:jgi/Chrzof1/3940/Cz13g14080.t1